MGLRVAIAADHAGFMLKGELVDCLGGDYDLNDLGAHTLDPDDDYPDFALAVARAVAVGRGGSGLGVTAAGRDGSADDDFGAELIAPRAHNAAAAATRTANAPRARRRQGRMPRARARAPRKPLVGSGAVGFAVESSPSRPRIIEVPTP